MQITMIPGACSSEYSPTGGSFCESCFARFLTRSGQTDLPCFTAVEDDGEAAQTLVMRAGDYTQSILLTEEARERLAYGEWQGWPAFVAMAEAQGL